jgi:NADH:ubiquinone oxidoreductase subunit K
VSAIDPIVSAIALIALARTQNVQIALIAALFALPILVLFAPSPFELALTILIEGSIVFVLSEMLRIDGTRAVLACCFVNVLTQPLLNLGLHSLSGGTSSQWWTACVAFELLVWATEAILYLACLQDLRRSKSGVFKAFAMSLAANGTSAGLGLLLPI